MVAPDALHTVVKSLRFLVVAPGKILCVQVNEPDVVISRVLETDVPYSPAELDALSERLTREYGGLTLHEVRRRLAAALAGASARRPAASWVGPRCWPGERSRRRTGRTASSTTERRAFSRSPSSPTFSP